MLGQQVFSQGWWPPVTNKYTLFPALPTPFMLRTDPPSLRYSLLSYLLSPESLLPHLNRSRHNHLAHAGHWSIYAAVNSLQPHNSPMWNETAMHDRAACDGTCQGHMTSEERDRDHPGGGGHHCLLLPRSHSGVITYKYPWGQLPGVQLYRVTPALCLPRISPRLCGPGLNLSEPWFPLYNKNNLSNAY